MIEEAHPAVTTENFWNVVIAATDPTVFRPARNPEIEVARLDARGIPYYVLKEPRNKSYLRLSEPDYAVWCQMDGRKDLKQLLYYNLKRYRTLPIGHLTNLIQELKQGHFLQNRPVNIYDHLNAALAARAPESRGRKFINRFLTSEIALQGLDDFFTPFYHRMRWLYAPISRFLFLLLVLFGGVLFVRLYQQQIFALSAGGGLGLFTFFAANLLVLGIHEMAHGLMTKHIGRELNRGGFLIYWGLPSFFVDTRDCWLSPRRQRIAVSWAGPYSGLVIGALVSSGLTAVAIINPALANTVWAAFFYQVAFVAYLSVFVNLNPLLELDGYFMLIDWLEMPGLRGRAFHFLRNELWPHLRAYPRPGAFWRNLDRTERIFTLFGTLAFAYSLVALGLAFSFWQSRLWPLINYLWQSSVWGQLVVLLLTAIVVLPTLYYLLLFGYAHVQKALEWLARRNLLARPDVIALLLGIPVLIGIPLLLAGLGLLPSGQFWQQLLIWVIHLAVIVTLAGIARQLPGSRFQWALWSLLFVPLGLAAAWFFTPWFARDLGLITAAIAIMSAGVVSWFTVHPHRLGKSDQRLMALVLLIGVVTFFSQRFLLNTLVLDTNLILWGRTLAMLVISLCIFTGLMLMAPLLLNFRRSRFALPWGLLLLGILSIPWLQGIPFLHNLVIIFWLYAGLVYLVLGALAQFYRLTAADSETAVFSERERVIAGFDHFIQAMFASYETVFGGRRLQAIQAQMEAYGPFDPRADILDISRRAQQALLLAIDRLDDLAGTPFTRRAGQAAYDSLSWPAAEALGRNVLANIPWGAKLAAGFIHARDRRVQLIRQAEIFAGFDRDGIDELLAISRREDVRPGQVIARHGDDALNFYLLEAGEVGVYHDGVRIACVREGGYFGMGAIAGRGEYQFTYQAQTTVSALIIDRDRFDPLLRADTTLAQQVSSGARERDLLKKMPLFSSLSPQQLAAVDARLQGRHIAAGDIFVRQDQPRSHLYIIAEGSVEVFFIEDGREHKLGMLGPGEHFGEYALFADTPYHANCRALTNIRLLLLDEEKFDELVAACERMTHYVEQIGSGRLINTNRRKNMILA